MGSNADEGVNINVITNYLHFPLKKKKFRGYIVPHYTRVYPSIHYSVKILNSFSFCLFLHLLWRNV